MTIEFSVPLFPFRAEKVLRRTWRKKRAKTRPLQADTPHLVTYYGQTTLDIGSGGHYSYP
jgi:hypothetical protein